MIKRRNLHNTLRRMLGDASYQYHAPAAGTATNIDAAISVTAGTYARLAADLDGQPDVPRQVLFTFVDGDTSITAGTLIVEGYDAWGVAQNETITGIVTATSLTYVTTKAYSHITSVLGTFTGAGAGDTLSMGTNGVLGLPMEIQAAGQLLSVLSGLTDDLLAGGTLDVTNDLYTPDSAPNGTLDYRFVMTQT